MSVDRIRQEPVIQHEERKSAVKAGTVVWVPWRDLKKAQFAHEDGDEDEFLDEADFEENEAENIEDSPRSNRDTKSRFLQIAESYAWLNPHTAIVVDWFGERTSIKATDPAWQKWKPSEPTSAHWYTTVHLERLIGAYLKHDTDNGRERTVREVVAEFRDSAAPPSRRSFSTPPAWRARRSLLSPRATDSRGRRSRSCSQRCKPTLRRSSRTCLAASGRNISDSASPLRVAKWSRSSTAA